MPVVHRFRKNVKVIIWADDHPPAHFHIQGPRTNCKVEIETLRVMVGQYDRIDLAEALRWAAHNIEFLCQEWRKYHECD